MKIILILLTLITSVSFASEHGGSAFQNTYTYPPSKTYSGDTPIDRSNGLFFNQGTYGGSNLDYENWAKTQTIAVGVSEAAYPYEHKDSFVKNMRERVDFFQAALSGLARKVEVEKPEITEYIKTTTELLKPKVERAEEALKKAKSANDKNWSEASEEMKTALLDLQNTYYAQHKAKNTQYRK